MRIKKLTAGAALAVAALGITDATASGQPITPSNDTASTRSHSAQGVDHGVGYLIAQDGKTLTAALDQGIFGITEDAITVTAADGSLVAALPLRLPAGEHEITLAPRVEADGTRLVADVSAEHIGYWRQTSPRQRSIESSMAIGSAAGAVAGGLVGGFVGVVVGIATGLLLLPITLPLGMFVGAVAGMAVGGSIGAAAGAAVPNSDVPDQWEYRPDCPNFGEHRPCS